MEFGRRYAGKDALSYLRDRQGDFLDFMSSMENGGAKAFRKGAESYYEKVKEKKKAAGE